MPCSHLGVTSEFRSQSTLRNAQSSQDAALCRLAAYWKSILAILETQLSKPAHVGMNFENADRALEQA